MKHANARPTAGDYIPRAPAHGRADIQHSGRKKPMAFQRACSVAAAIAALSTMPAFAALPSAPAGADMTWQWHYTGAGIDAGGTLTTAAAADADGFHPITAITGSRNGDAITGLYPTGSAIPGNEPYALDNLIRLGGPGQITVHGFGFSLASGAYANPYFADFLIPAAYSEVLTTATSFSEVPITFTASVVPEPATVALMLAGLGTLAVASSARRRVGRA
jgi:hypothetical protein